MHTPSAHPHRFPKPSEVVLSETIQSRRKSTERARGRVLAQGAIRDAVTRLLRQGDAEIGGTEQLRLAYRAELERQWAKV